MIYYQILNTIHYLSPSYYQKNKLLQISLMHHLSITTNIQNNNAKLFPKLAIFNTFFITHEFYLFHHFITFFYHFYHLYLKIMLKLILNHYNLDDK